MSIGQKFYLSLIFLLLIVGFLVYHSQQKVQTKYWLKNKSVASFMVGDTQVFKDDKGQWLFVVKNGNQQPADTELANFFVKGLQSMSLDTLVSNNSKNFESFGINQESPLVKVNDQKFLIGNLGPRYDSTYIELVDDNSVYEIPQIWGNKEVAKPNYWSLKFVNNISIYQITKILVDNKILEPKDGKWNLPDSVSKLAYLKAGKFLGEEKPDKLGSYVFRITMDNGEMVEVETGGFKNSHWAKNGKYYFQIDNSDFDLLTLLVK